MGRLLEKRVDPLEFTNTRITNKRSGEVSSASIRWRRVSSLVVKGYSISSVFLHMEAGAGVIIP